MPDVSQVSSEGGQRRVRVNACDVCMSPRVCGGGHVFGPDL